MQSRDDLESPLLLDTHVWIWLMTGDPVIRSSQIIRSLQKEDHSRRILISVISVWEVGMLESKGRILLPYSCLEWVKKALQAPGVMLAPITAEIAIASSCLPGGFKEGDPADRILIATARRQQAQIVTRDEHILDYAKTGHLKAVSAV